MSLRDGSAYCLLFYDINQINFYKYIPDLLTELASCSNLKIFLCYEESTRDKAALEFLAQFTNIKVGLFTSINSIIRKRDIDLVVVNAQRISDSLCISYANKTGIPTLMIQHGMYNGYLERKNDLYVRKLFKTIKYAVYAFKIGIISQSNPFSMVYRFIRVFSFGDSYKELLGAYSLLYVKNLHVYGKYWIGYHKEFFGYTESITKFSITGYPELSKTIQSEKVDFCYIAQSLYEDGRISLDGLSRSLKMLAELQRDYSVVVKRHPRSNNQIYREFGLRTTDSMPNAAVYIGHYSSLLALPLAMGRKVAIVSLDGHVIPEYFLSSSFSVSTTGDLIKVLHGQSGNQDIDDVFKFPIESTEHKNMLLDLVDTKCSI